MLARVAGLRALSTTAARRSDFVQDLYLRELKAYKAPAPVRIQKFVLLANQSPDAHKGAVREFATPAAPSAPASLSSSELAAELEKYASSEPDLAAAPASSADEAAAAETEDVNAYLAQLQADVKVEAHH
ncbi:hypothetical protein MCUN1_003087 [Malassezia cuniculi]|uniref:Uncharacterized protein n=1 Tax=Malassezia cuniculi TaxID=948313 RepID=A0AAF0J7L3_9BASI|nr:hypothetical protein MCUN1_003087 [Malassezia cuniculi]